jgi:hypothetical protein
MSSTKDLVARHVAALLAEAEAQKIPADVIGRTLLDEVIGLWSRSRPAADIKSELEFVAGNLGDDAEFYFMRP